MSSDDMQVIDCLSIDLGGRYRQVLKDKDALKLLSGMLRRPILKCKNEYAIIDATTAYIYQKTGY